MFSSISKRLRVLIAVLIGVLVLGCGTIFTLAKTGVINIKMLADEKAASYSVSVNIMPPPGEAQRQNVRVLASRRNDATGDYSSPAVTGTTNQEGTLSVFSNLSAGSYKFFIADRPTCSYAYGDVPTQTQFAIVDSVCSTPPPAEEQFFSITGKVLDANSRSGINGITVSFPGSASVLTSNDGSFSLPNIRLSAGTASSYIFYFSDDFAGRPVKYASAQKKLTEMGINSTIVANGNYPTTVPVYLRLSPGADLSLGGSIYAPANEHGDELLVPNAKVEIFKTGATNAIASAISTGASTPVQGGYAYNYKTGNFLYNSTDVSGLAIKITALGYKTIGPIALQSPDIISPNAGESTTGQLNIVKDFVLENDIITFFGYVKDDSNKFIPGVKVTLIKGDNSEMGSTITTQKALPQFSGVTGANYKISNLRRDAGNIRVVLTLPPGYTGRSDYRVNLFETQSQDFNLVDTTATLYGTVKDESGKVMPNLKITFTADKKVIATTSSLAKNAPTPGITQPHNYEVPRVNKDNRTITAVVSTPQGYTFAPVSFVIPQDAKTYRKDLILDKIIAASSITLIGEIKQRGTENYITDLKIHVYSLRGNNTPPPYNTTTTAKMNDGIASSHNFKITGFKPSTEGKYLIEIEAKGEASRGYKASMAAFTKLVYVKDGVYRLPQPINLEKASTIEWSLYRFVRLITKYSTETLRATWERIRSI